MTPKIGTHSALTPASRISFPHCSDCSNDFAGMNEVWDAWVSPGNAPTRATAECNLALPEILVEIIVTAAV